MAEGDTMQSMGTNAGNQLQVQIDDNDVPTTYASIVQVRGSGEEVIVDFGGPLKMVAQGQAVLRVNERVILNPWAAKRLQMALTQAIEGYEQAYGPLELDDRKRREKAGSAPSGDTKPN